MPLHVPLPCCCCCDGRHRRSRGRRFRIRWLLGEEEEFTEALQRWFISVGPNCALLNQIWFEGLDPPDIAGKKVAAIMNRLRQEGRAFGPPLELCSKVIAPKAVPPTPPTPPPVGPQTFTYLVTDFAYGGAIVTKQSGLTFDVALARAQGFNATHGYPSLLGASVLDERGAVVS